MNIEHLQARVYYLMGQLDEAKKIANDAQGELDAKKQPIEKATKPTATKPIKTFIKQSNSTGKII